MALFRRSSERGSQGHTDRDREHLTDFWDWWTTEGRAAAERRLAGDLPAQELAASMAQHLAPLGGLSWELTAGDPSPHALLLNSEGDPELRALARRVVLAAPPGDEAWSYLDTRPPAAEPEEIMLGSDGELIDFDRVRVAARLQGEQFEVTVHHPTFADLPEEARERITRLALDATLGETGSELWLGEVRASQVPPLDGFSLTALRAVVSDLERQHVDPDGRPRWVMLRGQTPSGPLVAVVRRVLRPMTAPHLDTYVSLALPYGTSTDDGLPDEDAEVRLESFQERLSAGLGTSGEVVAHLSTGGVRTFHLYLDSTAGLLPEIKRIAKSWDQGRASVHEMHDPDWEAVAHLRQ